MTVSKGSQAMPLRWQSGRRAPDSAGAVRAGRQDTAGSVPMQRYGLAIFWVAVVLVWIGTLGYRTLITPDEGRYATLSLEMLQSGDFVTPHLNGLLYFEKPALQYWAGAASFMLFGINEFAARFWPGLTSLLSVAVVGFVGKRLWGSEAGMLSALVMGGTAFVYGNGHFLTLDAGLMFFLALALGGFLLAHRDEATDAERRRWMWLVWAAMAGATLSKGLVGVLVPGATLFLYMVVGRQWGLWRRLHWPSGLALYLVLAAPWFVAVSLRNPGFADFFFLHEHFDRFLTTEHHRAGPLWYFVPVLLAGMVPWTSMLLPALREGLVRSEGEIFRPRLLLLIWTAFVFAFFSLSGSKLPSYILPMFPALALLIGSWLGRAAPEEIRVHLWLPLALGLIGLVASPLAQGWLARSVPVEVVTPLIEAIALAAGILLAATALAISVLSCGRKLAAVTLVAAGGLVAVAVGAAGHESYGAALRSSKAAVAALRPHIEPGTPVFAVGEYDQTLAFYLRKPLTLVAFSGEFEFGQGREPGRWIPTVEEFVARWKTLPQAAAVMPHRNFVQLSDEGLPMRIVYSGHRNVVVVKP
jgi:4-amino-4-deoxy-L-arabinose transferase-like glycosyltransferase